MKKRANAINSRYQCETRQVQVLTVLTRFGLSSCFSQGGIDWLSERNSAAEVTTSYSASDETLCAKSANALNLEDWQEAASTDERSEWSILVGPTNPIPSRQQKKKPTRGEGAFAQIGQVVCFL